MVVGVYGSAVSPPRELALVLEPSAIPGQRVPWTASVLPATVRIDPSSKTAPIIYMATAAVVHIASELESGTTAPLLRHDGSVDA